MQKQTSETSPGTDVPGEAPVDRLKQEAARLIEVSGTSLGMVSALAQLAASEIYLSLKTLPKLAGIALLMLPLAFLTWIAFSALVACIFTYLFSSTLAGFFTFFLCQVALMAVCLVLLKRYKKLLGIPRTKEQAKAVFETLKHEITG